MKKFLTLLMGILMGCCAFCSGCDFFGGEENIGPEETVSDKVTEEEWVEVFANTIEYLYGVKDVYAPLLQEQNVEEWGEKFNLITLPDESNYKIVYECHRKASESESDDAIVDTTTATIVVANGKMYTHSSRVASDMENRTYELYAEKKDTQDGQDLCDIFERYNSWEEWHFRSTDCQHVMPIDLPFFNELSSSAGLVYTDVWKEKGGSDYWKEMTGEDCVFTYHEDGNFYEGPSFDLEHAPEEAFYRLKARYKIHDGKIVYIGVEECYPNSRYEPYSYSVEITYGGQNVEIPPEALTVKNSK